MRAMQASLRTRLGSAAAVAVLAAGGAMATATAASAAGHPSHKPLDATTLSIRNKAIVHKPIRHHKASAIIGVLRDERTRVAGETITLESRTGKKPRWTAVGSMATGTDGSVSFTVAPAVRTQYKLVFAGDKATGFRRSHSNVVTVNVGRKK